MNLQPMYAIIDRMRADIDDPTVPDMWIDPAVAERVERTFAARGQPVEVPGGIVGKDRARRLLRDLEAAIHRMAGS